MAIENQDYKEFSKKINETARTKRIPLHAMLELTYRCNFRCIHCYISDQQKKAKPEEIVEQ